MKSLLQSLYQNWVVVVWVVAIGVAAGGGWLTQSRWMPYAKALVSVPAASEEEKPVATGEANSIHIDPNAWKNVGLRTGTVKLQDYEKTVSLPAMIVERTGRSLIEITAPVTGIVTRVHTIEGEAIMPGQLLFELRLTHEDIVNGQRDFLRFAQELDIVQAEVLRLERIGEEVIKGNRIVEKKYELQKVQATLAAQRQGLLLHGLTSEQIDSILTSRQLLQKVVVVAPPFDEVEHNHDVEHVYHVQEMKVNMGQHVTAGDGLEVLADHCQLYIEGQAFEDDSNRLSELARQGSPLEVVPLYPGSSGAGKLSLKILYVSDRIDAVSRSLKFYMTVPNVKTRDDQSDGHRFIAWKFRPGQRLEVRIPVSDVWENQIVLPPEAVVEDGVQAFVFEQNGDHFDRVPVHILFRDKDAVVIENDGSLLGSVLAMSGAYQMHLELKNHAGGAPDPHAGHNHG